MKARIPLSSEREVATPIDRPAAVTRGGTAHTLQRSLGNRIVGHTLEAARPGTPAFTRGDHIRFAPETPGRDPARESQLMVDLGVQRTASNSSGPQTIGDAADLPSPQIQRMVSDTTHSSNSRVELLFGAAAAGPARDVPFRSEMERSFGRDLGGARAVLDRPAELRAMGAVAATRGDTIVFAKDRPSRLEVAHELAHYVQNNLIGGSSAPARVQNRSILSEPGDEAEQEAESVARRVVAGERVDVRSAPTGAIQRMLVGWELETTVPIYKNGNRPDNVDSYAAQASEYAHEDVDASLRDRLGAQFEIHIDGSRFASKSALTLLNSNANMHIAEIIVKPVASRSTLLSRMQAVRGFLSYFTSHRELRGNAYTMGWPVPQSDFGSHTQNTMEMLFHSDWAATAGTKKVHDVYTQLTFQGTPDSLSTISDLDSERIKVGKQTVASTSKSNRGKLVSRDVYASHPVVSRGSMSAALKIETDTPLATRAVDVAVKIFKDALYFLSKGYMGTVKNAVAFMIRSDLNKLFLDLDQTDRNEFAKRIAYAIEKLKPQELALPKELQERFFTDDLKAIFLDPGTHKVITKQSPEESGELEHIDESLQNAVSTKAVMSSGDQAVLPWEVFTGWCASQVFDAVRHEEPRSHVVSGPLHGLNALGILPELEDLGQPRPKVVFENRTPIPVNVNTDELPEPVEQALDQVGFPTAEQQWNEYMHLRGQDDI